MQENTNIKILVISNNVFSKTSSMGKTLMSYFRYMENIDIAQFYIHSEIPTSDFCKNYYRITDKEIIKSIITRKCGSVLSEADIKSDVSNTRTDTGNTAKLYQQGKKKSPLIYFARNLWWALGKWKTRQLLSWVDEFDPDVVFFASGDSAFMYKIALGIAKYKQIPLVISCMDDYYFFNKNANRFGGKLVHKLFMKQVKKTMDYATCIFPICEKMGKDYGEYFSKPYHTLCTPSTLSAPLELDKTNAISYIGNFGYKRNSQIVAIGKALKSLDIEGKPEFIDVYSAESRPEILADLTEENGIRFHGSISADKVLEVMGKSLAVIHTESFDAITRKTVAYSVSTKIADSLASGTPIFAYGPSEIASIEYLSENNAAFCAHTEEDLEGALRELITNSAKRDEVIANALELAGKNHDPHNNCTMVREILGEVCNK